MRPSERKVKRESKSTSTRKSKVSPSSKRRRAAMVKTDPQSEGRGLRQRSTFKIAVDQGFLCVLVTRVFRDRRQEVPTRFFVLFMLYHASLKFIPRLPVQEP